MKQKESREKGISTKLVWLVAVVMSLCLTFMGPSASQALITQTTKVAVEATDDNGDIEKESTSKETNGMTLEAPHDSGDVDCFKIELPEYGTLTLFTTGDMDTTGSFEDEYSRLAWDDDGGEKGNFLIIEPLKAGVYYLIVSGWDANSVGSYYTLGLEFTPDVISRRDDLNNSPLGINEYITVKDSPSDVGNVSAYYSEKYSSNSGQSSSTTYKDAKEGASTSPSEADSKDKSDSAAEQDQRLVVVAQTGLPAEALEAGMTMAEIFEFAASMQGFGGDERLADPKTWGKVSELGPEAVLTDTVRENIGIPEGTRPGASVEELLEGLEDIQGLGGDPSDERWWNDLVGSFREKEGIPKGALPGASIEDLLEGLGDIQGVGGDPSDPDIWGDLADVRSGDMSPEDFIEKWNSSGQGQGSQDGGNDGSGSTTGSTPGYEAPFGDEPPIPGDTSNGSSNPGSGSDDNDTGGPETPTEPETPADEGPDTEQDVSDYTVTVEHTDDGGFDLTVCDWSGCESDHFVPDENGGFESPTSGETVTGENGKRPTEGTCSSTADSNGNAVWDCGTEDDTNADSKGDAMPNPNDDDCMGPYCDDLAEDGLLYEETLPTYNEDPVTDPDDPNDGVVNTAPRENIQLDPDVRLAPYINPGDTEGDVDESILPVRDPVLDQNHNPEPIDPQPELSGELTNSGAAAAPDGNLGSTPNGTFMN